MRGHRRLSVSEGRCAEGPQRPEGQRRAAGLPKAGGESGTGEMLSLGHLTKTVTDFQESRDTQAVGAAFQSFTGRVER